MILAHARWIEYNIQQMEGNAELMQANSWLMQKNTGGREGEIGYRLLGNAEYSLRICVDIRAADAVSVKYVETTGKPLVRFAE